MPIIALFNGPSALLRATSTVSQVERLKEQNELFRTSSTQVRPSGLPFSISGPSRTFFLPEEISQVGPNLIRFLAGQLASWQFLGLKFNSLMVRVSSLLRERAFANTLASSSRPDVVEATGGGIREDEGGRFRVEVSQLAQAQRIASDAFPNPLSPLGLKGAIIVDGVEIGVNPSDSLVDIKFSLNEAFASAAFSSHPSLLQASAGPQAAEATYRITISQLAAADQPAIFTVDGRKFARDTNEVEDAIPGVRLILRDTTREGERITLTVRNVAKEDGVIAEIEDKRLVLSSKLTGDDGISLSDRGGILEKLGFTESTHIALSQVRGEGVGGGDVAVSGVPTEVRDFVVRVRSVGTPTLVEVSRDGGATFHPPQPLPPTGTIDLGIGAKFTFLDPSSLVTGDVYRFSTFVAERKLKNELSEARNARFTVDGKPFERPTNVIEDVIDGVALTLKGTTRRPVALDIKQDISGPQGLIRDFVESYNSLMVSLNRQAALGGSLSEDQALGRVRSQIEGSVSRPVEGLPPEADEAKDIGIEKATEGRMRINELSLITLLNRLRSQMVSDVAQSVDGIPTFINSLDKIGIVQEEAGTLVIDEAKLSSALSSNTRGVKELFAKESEDRFKGEFLEGSPSSPGARREAQAGQGIAVRLAERLQAIAESRVGVVAFRAGIISALASSRAFLNERGKAIEAELEKQQSRLGSQLVAFRELSSASQAHRTRLLSAG
jgi:flagellar capping protein FliD